MPVVNPGIRRFLGSAIQRLFNSASFYAPLTHSLALERGTGSPSFTRASTATVMGYGPTDNAVDGLKLLTVAANEARFVGARRISEGVWSNTFADGSLIPAATNTGYLAEGARTNLTIWNRDLTNAAWARRSGTVTTALTATGADGAANSATAVRNLGASGVDDLYQTAGYAVASGTRVEPSLSLRTVSTSGTLRFANSYDVGASGSWNIDLSLVSTTRMERITRDHPAVTVTTEWIGSGLNFVQPIFDTASGPLDFDVDLIQVEVGTASTSEIPTTTAAVTRAADQLTYPSAGNISGAVGAAYCEIKTGSVCGRSLSFNAGGTGMIDAGTGDSLSFRAYDETNVVNVTVGDSSASTVKQAIAWGGSTLSAARNGTTASGSFDGNMSPTGISIGGTTGGELNGTIRNVRIWNRQLSASEMQAITAP